MIPNKEKDLSAWYIELVQQADLMDYSAIKGFYIYKPYLYDMWEKYKSSLEAEIRKEGVQDAYFPILIPESLLKKEVEHIEGFTPEVAWVERAGDKKLEERYAVRPTSETIMYYSYSKWIHSYKDLPLKLNQWNNMVRWETKETRFLLRQRENLWQEGHSAFKTAEEADKDARKMLEIYSKIIKDLLAIPFFAGRKSESEKFAGAVTSYTLETIFDNGYAAQIATSHYLGQNFSKAFDIKFLNENNQWEYVYQTSWGTSTRLLGAMIIIHSDNTGLILPPKIAPIQFVIIPIIYSEEDKSLKSLELSKLIFEKIKSFGFSCKLDDSLEKTPGWKYNEYELKGIPFRISVGEKEVLSREISIKRRFDGKIFNIKLDELSKEFLEELIEKTQTEMYEKAQAKINKLVQKVKDSNLAIDLLKLNKPLIVSWCNEIECEKHIKDLTGATSRVILDDSPEEKVCVFCGNKARVTALFAKSF